MVKRLSYALRLGFSSHYCSHHHLEVFPQGSPVLCHPKVERVKPVPSPKSVVRVVSDLEVLAWVNPGAH